MASVFIGIPTINRPELVRHTIRSVLNQTYSDIEVVVSDNCSEPGVAESIMKFLAGINDERIRFHQQEKNVGEYGQGRYFFSEAKNSQYFMILHDDDFLCENYIEKAIECLDKSIDSAYFVADAYIVNEHGDRTEQVKQKFLKDHGRNDASQGEFPVLDYHLHCGFTLISGTFFRTEVLKESGFVDSEGVGNYPFESEIFLRLGDLGAKAWYQKEELLAFCFHTNSLRHHTRLMDNEKVVSAMIRIFACRHYTGYNERRRKVTIGRLYRAKALIAVRQGRAGECRKYIMKCFRYNALSIKLWLVTPLAITAPGILSWLLPRLPTPREAPILEEENQLE